MLVLPSYRKQSIDLHSKSGSKTGFYMRATLAFNELNHILPMSPFYTSSKNQKAKGYLVSSRKIKWEHWLGYLSYRTGLRKHMSVICLHVVSNTKFILVIHWSFRNQTVEVLLIKGKTIVTSPLKNLRECL